MENVDFAFFFTAFRRLTCVDSVHVSHNTLALNLGLLLLSHSTLKLGCPFLRMSMVRS